MNNFKKIIIKIIWKYQSYFSKLFKIKSNRGFTDNNYDKIICEEIIRILELNNNDSENYKILDIGCGKGDIAILLAQNINKKIIAVDFLNNFQKNFNNQNIVFIQAISNKLPFQDESFDNIICYSLLQYLPITNIINLLEELKKKLKISGKILLGEIISKKKYFNSHILSIDCNLIKKILIFIYLNFIYQYYFHSKNSLEILYTKLGLDYKYVEQDKRLPYSKNAYNVVLYLKKL